MPAKRKRKRRNTRLTAQIWVCAVQVALRDGMRSRFAGWDLDLAAAVYDANVVHCALHVACKFANIPPDELIEAIRPVIDEEITKKARDHFAAERARIAALESKRKPGTEVH